MTQANIWIRLPNDVTLDPGWCSGSDGFPDVDCRDRRPGPLLGHRLRVPASLSRIPRHRVQRFPPPRRLATSDGVDLRAPDVPAIPRFRLRVLQSELAERQF